MPRFLPTLLFSTVFLLSDSTTRSAPSNPRLEELIDELNKSGSSVALTHLPNGTTTTSVSYRGAPDGLEKLNDLPNVTELEIATEISATGFQHLLKLESLKRLAISSGTLTHSDLEIVGRLTNLEWLKLDHVTVGDAGLDLLSPLRRLKRLGLHYTGLSDAGLADLKSLQLLEELQVSGEFSGAGLSHLTSLPHLRTFGFATDKLEPTQLRHLAAFPHLETFCLGFQDLRDNDLEYLPQMMALTLLELSHSSHLTPSGLAYLTNQPQLRTLVVPDQHDDSKLLQVTSKVQVVLNRPNKNALSALRDFKVDVYDLHSHSDVIGSDYIFESERFFQGLWINSHHRVESQEATQLLNVLTDPRTFQAQPPKQAPEMYSGVRFLSASGVCDVLLTGTGVAIHPDGLSLIETVERNPTPRFQYLSEKGIAELSRLDKKLMQNNGDDGQLRVRLSPSATPDDLADYIQSDAQGFGARTDVKELDASRSQISDAELPQIARLVNLEKLDLSHTDISDLGLNDLRGLQKLRQVETAGTRVTQKGLEDLAQYIPRLAKSELSDDWLLRLGNQGDLRALSLSNARISDAGLAHLSKLQNLEVLILEDTQVSDTGMQYLQGLTKLVRLDVSGTKVTGKGLARLSGLPRLEALVAGRIAAGTVHLRQLPKLTEIDLSESRVEELSLEDVGSLDSLALARQPMRKLVLADAPLLSSIRFEEMSIPEIVVRGSTKVLELQCSGEPVNDAGLARLESLRDLNRILLASCSVDGSGFTHLAQLAQLAALEIYDAPVTGPGLAKLKAAPQLRTLRLNKTKLADGDVRYIRDLPHLEALELGDAVESHHVQFSDRALAQLSGMTQLRKLKLYSAEITDVGFTNLIGLRNLQSLSLSRTNVSGSALASFQSLKDLRSLVLVGSHVTGDDLKYFDNMQNLTSLYLYQSALTRRGAETLRRRLPGCDIRY